MAGLRAKQKADKTRRILEAATFLFKQQGYESATIEHIADMAEVSVGTLYNYYQNKGDILVATVAMEVTEVLEAGARLVANPPMNVAEALRTLVGQYYDHSLVYLSKEMWRTAMALSIQQPDTPLSRRYTELDQQLCDQVIQLIGILQARGIVKADLDPKTMGEVFFNNLNAMFMEFCRNESISIEDLKMRVNAQHEPLARLISSVNVV